MTDSFASAHSFDPFQHGAPGFKVPAVLPPGLIHSLTAPGNTIGNSLRTTLGSAGSPSQSQGHPSSISPLPASMAKTSSASNMSPPSSSNPTTGSLYSMWNNNGQARPPPSWNASGDRSRHSSWTQGSMPQSQHLPGESFEDFVRRSSMSARGHPPDMSQQHQHLHRHAQSFSGPSVGHIGEAAANQPWGWPADGPNQAMPGPSVRPAGGAYGQNRAWQMQQLEALQAERQRFLEARKGQPGQPDQPIHAMPSGSTLVRNDRTPAAYPTPPGMSQSLPTSGGSLSTLGLSFPSSHDFPAASPPDGHQAGNYPSVGSRLTEGDADMADDSGSRSKAREWPSNNRSDEAGSHQNDGQGAGGDLSRSDSSTGLYRPWPKAPSPSEPSEAYPPVRLDLDRLDSKQFKSKFPALTDAFYGRDPAQERRDCQPHLVGLKERRKEERAKREEMLEEKRRKALQRRGLDPDASNTGGEDGDEDTKGKDGSPDGAAGSDGAGSGSAANSAKGKKPPHVLLTEAEKKANHIASEQKRRANIRKGYEMLCAGVPALREALEKDEGEDTGGEGGAAGDNGGSYEVGGERLDGRAGPRSEAVVLGKSVEHLRHLLEIHRDLRSRRDHARLKLARKSFSVDLLVGLGGGSIGDLAAAAASSRPTNGGKGSNKSKNSAGSKSKSKSGQSAPAKATAPTTGNKPSKVKQEAIDGDQAGGDEQSMEQD